MRARTNQNNKDIENIAKQYKVNFWEVANALGVSEGTITRWMRTDMPTEKKAKVIEAIQSIATKRADSCAAHRLYDAEMLIPLSDRDTELERLWGEFADVPMNPETEEMEEPFLHFPAGTNREEIWRWFDERHSKGVVYLLYGTDAKYSLKNMMPLVHMNSLCCECDSEHCAFNPQGICKAPFVIGRAPSLSDDGCADFCYKGD